MWRLTIHFYYGMGVKMISSQLYVTFFLKQRKFENLIRQGKNGCSLKNVWTETNKPFKVTRLCRPGGDENKTIFTRQK